MSRIYDDNDKSEQAAAKAVELFTPQLKKEPNNGRLAMKMGQALWTGQKYDEAEKMFRQAVKVSPKDADCWLSLGDSLLMKSFNAVLGVDGKKAPDPMAVIMRVFTRTVPPENLEAGRKFAREASVCADRAVATAPRQPKPYMCRTLTRAMDIFLEEFGQVVTGKEDDSAETAFRVIKRLADANILADVKKAAELDPTNPRAQALVGVVEVGSIMGGMLLSLKKADPAEKEKIGKEAEVKIMQAIDNTMTRLHVLTTHKEKRIAAEACYLEGLVLYIKAKMLNNDHPNPEQLVKAEQLLRRSVALEPGNQSTWDWLVGVSWTRIKRIKRSLPFAKSV